MTNLPIAPFKSRSDDVVRDGVDPTVSKGTSDSRLGRDGDHTLVTPGRST